MSHDDTTPDVHRVVHPWLGCAWGRDLISAADRCICTEQAVQVLAIHPAPGDPRFVELLLCAKHRDIVLAASTPTEGVTP